MRPFALERLLCERDNSDERYTVRKLLILLIGGGRGYIPFPGQKPKTKKLKIKKRGPDRASFAQAVAALAVHYCHSRLRAKTCPCPYAADGVEQLEPLR